MDYDQYFNQAKTVPVEQVDDQTRKTIARNIANMVNEFFPYRTVEDERLDQLNKNGFTPLKTFTEEQIDDIVNYLKNKTVYNAHVPYGDGQKRNLTEAREYPFGCYELVDLVSCPHILKLALDKEILDLAANYLHCTPTLYSINSWWSFPGKGVAVTQSYHRDYDDYKFLALFIYLTDVTIKNGAHCYIQRTHDDSLPYSDELLINEQVFTGEAGTSFLSDTYGIHKSMPLIEGDRLVIWLRYGLSNNGPAMAQIRNPISKSLIPDSIDFDDRLNFITRLILT